MVMDEVQLHLAADPLALVTEADAHEVFHRELLEPLGRLPCIVTSPVKLELTCATRPSRQPGAVDYPNLDKWLRPLTGALAGADRLLLGGSQVRGVQVNTTPRSGDPGRLSIRVVLGKGLYVPKTDLRLAAFPEGWCACLATSLSRQRARQAARRLSQTVSAATRCALGAHHLMQQGLIRRRDVAADVPIVDAAALLDDTAEPPHARGPVTVPAPAAPSILMARHVLAGHQDGWRGLRH